MYYRIVNISKKKEEVDIVRNQGNHLGRRKTGYVEKVEEELFCVGLDWNWSYIHMNS